MDGVELGDIYAELHRGAAIEDRQLRRGEPLLPLLAVVVWHLCGMFARLKVAEISGGALVEVAEEVVYRLLLIARAVVANAGDDAPHWVTRDVAVAEAPDDRLRVHLIAAIPRAADQAGGREGAEQCACKLFVVCRLDRHNRPVWEVPRAGTAQVPPEERTRAATDHRDRVAAGRGPPTGGNAKEGGAREVFVG